MDSVEEALVDLQDQKPDDTSAPQGSYERSSQDDNSPLENKTDSDPSAQQTSALQHSEKDISNTAQEDNMDVDPDASQGPARQPTENDNSPLENKTDSDPFAHQTSALQHTEKDISNTAPENNMDVDLYASQGPASQPTENDNNAAFAQDKKPGKHPGSKVSTSQSNWKDDSHSSKKRFFVKLEGKTKEAHQDVVTRLKYIGHIQVESVEESEILLVFCPIVSRVGTDISNALENISDDDKPTILVVMHPTFKPDLVVADSRRLVEKRNVKLTVDCLFHDGKLLNCNRNEAAWASIQDFVGVPPPEGKLLNCDRNDIARTKVKLFFKLRSPQGSTSSITPKQEQMAAKPSANKVSTSQSNRKDDSHFLGRRFFVKLEGKTKEAHQDVVTRLKDIGHIQVGSVEESEILLVFCPIVSRVGTDISNALENISDDGKPTILVVMHPTFKPDLVVADSRRLVEKRNVKLTVDCLFHDGKLLNCNRNEAAWASIQDFVGVPPPEASQNTSNRDLLKTIQSWLSSLSSKKPK